MPDQIKDLLNHFSVTKNLDKMLGKQLAIDWWQATFTEEDILILAPNIVGNDSIQYPANPKGKCVFYKNKLCKIYKFRPYECSEYFHDEPLTNTHEKIARAWSKSKILSKYKKQIQTQAWTIFDETLNNINVF
jgi:Fe-S-cluster containining protein